MSDRELLELAAKAIGIPLEWTELNIPRTTGWREWNPLVNDGDALRLAVKLGIGVSSFMDESYSGDNNVARARHFDCGEIDEHADDNDGDILAATRRAIVRAAAQLGRIV